MLDLRSPGAATSAALPDGPTPSLSLVIPAFDEEWRLPGLFAALEAGVDFDRTEIVIVDDGSSDATAEVAAAFVEGLPFGVVHRLGSNHGKGRAVREGVRRARGDIIAFMDADSATEVGCVEGLVDALKTHDVAVGSRAHADSVVANARLSRAVMGQAFNGVVRSLTGLSLRDTQCGFKAFRAPVAHLLFEMSTVDGFAFDVEVLALADRLGFSIGEVPVRWRHVEGSKIRHLFDPLTMTWDSVRAVKLPRHRHVHAVRLAGHSEEELQAAIGTLCIPLLVSPGPDFTDIIVPQGGEAHLQLTLAHLRARGLRGDAIVHDTVELLKKRPPMFALRPNAADTGGDTAADPLERGSATRDAARRMLRRGKYLMGHHPATLPVLLRMTPTGTSRQIGPDTDLVVEGFPRSGNTFASFAVRQAAGPDVEVVSHVHHPNQVKLAVQRGLPTVLVIREPLGALASYLIAGPHGRPRGVLREYIGYHRELIPYVPDLLVVDFDQITVDMGEVTDQINERFGTTIPRFEHDEANVAAVYEAIEAYHDEVHGGDEGIMARPSVRRGDLNASHRAELTSDRHRALLEEANGVYRQVRRAAGLA